MLRRARQLALLSTGALFWLSQACGSGAPEIPDELLGDGDGDGDGYPSGPYGAEVGDTLEDFSFQGYRDPLLARELEEIRLKDFYDPMSDKGIQLVLINTAAAWCQPCIIEHGDLPARTSQYAEEGLVIFSTLFQDSDGEPAREETLSAWTRTFDTNFPIAVDPSYQMGRYGPAETPPLNLVVDPRDMSLLATFIGNQEGPLWSFIENELEQRNQK